MASGRPGPKAQWVRSFRSPACWVTSRLRWWGRSALLRVRPRTPTGPGTSCYSTPVTRRCDRRTVCSPPCATSSLEGSIAVTGSAVQWLRDQLKIIRGADEIETLAGQVENAGGAYFVPAFSGLFAPYWRADARGAIVGLSRYHTGAHLARATLEAICYQTRDVVEAMEKDSQVHLSVLKVDGGVTANSLCMQLQADILGVDVSKPVVAETTALGAAYAAGLALGFWTDVAELRQNWQEANRWTPQWTAADRDAGYAGWQRAVQRTLDWVPAT